VQGLRRKTPAQALAMVASKTDRPLSPAPIEKSWIRAGNPQARNVVLSRSADGTATTILWECTAGEFDWTYNIDETIYFIEGEATIGDGCSPPRRFLAGDVLFLPSGTVAHWRVDSYVRKVAFCRQTQPAVIVFGLRVRRKLKRLAGRFTAACKLRPAVQNRPASDDALPAWCGGSD
jgi:uncharacterized cupin superfamily protein